MNGKESADEVLAVVDDEELDDVVDDEELDEVDVVDVDDAGAAVEVEEVEDDDDVVDELEEVGVALVVMLVVRRAAEELLVSLVDPHAHEGEGARTRYAPNAATAMTTTTIPARTVVPTATRRSENLEQDIRVVRLETNRSIMNLLAYCRTRFLHTKQGADSTIQGA